MSIWKELYDIYDKERTIKHKSYANKQALIFEIRSNLTFLVDALKNDLSEVEIVNGLEHVVFDDCMKEGVNLNTMRKNKVTFEIIGGIDEFTKYIGKDTEYLVKNAYLKMSSLSKLVKVKSGHKYHLRIKSLFKFLMLLLAHLEGRKLAIRLKKSVESR